MIEPTDRGKTGVIVGRNKKEKCAVIARRHNMHTPEDCARKERAGYVRTCTMYDMI